MQNGITIFLWHTVNSPSQRERERERNKTNVLIPLRSINVRENKNKIGWIMAEERKAKDKLYRYIGEIETSGRAQNS